MADRTVYGLDYSENGWRMVDQGSCVWVTVPGTDVHLQIREGQPARILGAWAADWNAYIEPLRDADSACWTPTNRAASSNHLSGTAVDLNWGSHPFRQRGSLNAEQMRTLAEMEQFYEGTVFWAGRWDDPADEMHSQMGYNTYGRENVDRVQDFINRKIRSDGFSTFRRGAMPAGPDPAQVLSDAMLDGVGIDRYRQLLPAVSACLRDCDCTSVARIAMWVAQIGTESAGLKYMEEIASGAEYEGRTDLGNTEPGDGVRFKGRGPIQVTGRHNYTELSQWAFDKGLVPSPTFFVDQPAQLASDKYGFIGVTWYWTTQRPMNDAADARDIERASIYVNGRNRNTGRANGIENRTNRYNHALGMGDQLLTLTTEEDDPLSALNADEQRELLDLARQQAKYRRNSLSPLRHLGEGEVNTCAGFAWSADGLIHPQFVLMAAKFGHLDSIALLAEIAGADPQKYPDRAEDAKLAAAMLKEIEETNPEVLREYLAVRGAAV